MALVVICPGCKTRLTVDDDRGGTTFDCPKCDTAISVPVVVGPPPAPAPPPRRAPALPPWPLPPPPLARYDLDPEDDEDEEDLAAMRRRRKSRKSRNRLLFMLAVVTLLGIACVIVVPMAIQRVEDARAGKLRVRDTNSLNATERQVVGVWNISEASSTETISFKSDHTFIALGRNGTTVKYDIRGNWHVEGEVLSIRAISMEATGEIGETLKEVGDVNIEVPLTIISVSETKMHLRSKTGKRAVVYTRL